jgi:hypothetical protein
VLPPLALGMGIYLPMALTLFIPVGRHRPLLRPLGRKSQSGVAERLGVLAATGLIAGESLFGVIFAGMRPRNSATPLENYRAGRTGFAAGHGLFAAPLPGSILAPSAQRPIRNGRWRIKGA